jgi:hypothetical protein
MKLKHTLHFMYVFCNCTPVQSSSSSSSSSQFLYFQSMSPYVYISCYISSHLQTTPLCNLFSLSILFFCLNILIINAIHVHQPLNHPLMLCNSHGCSLAQSATRTVGRTWWWNSRCACCRTRFCRTRRPLMVTPTLSCTLQAQNIPIFNAIRSFPHPERRRAHRRSRQRRRKIHLGYRCRTWRR